MEIKVDLTRSSGVQVRKAADNVPVRVQNQTTQTQVSSGQGSSRRDLMNAMSLMQTASGIVQEALNASSKLRSMAMATMVSGGSDYTEVAQTISGIQSSLQEYGRPVLSPVVNDAKPAQNTTQEIGRELEVMGRMAREKKVDVESLSAAEKSLYAVKSDLDKKIQASMKEFGGDTSAAVPDSAALSRKLTGNYQQALAAQGNIVQDSVASLLR